MRRITVRGIIVKDGKLFAQKLKKKDGGARNYWCTPGGGLDDGESIHDGLVREMVEETGVTPIIGALLYMQQYTEDDGSEFLEFFFHITNADDYESIDLATTSHGLAEVSQYGFVDTKVEHILPAFIADVDIEKDIVNGTPVQFFTYMNESI